MNKFKFKVILSLLLVIGIFYYNGLESYASKTIAYETDRYVFHLQTNGTAQLYRADIVSKEEVLEIPSHVTYKGKQYQVNKISAGAFWSESSTAYIKQIIIPEGIEKIGKGAFSGYAYIEEINIPVSAKVVKWSLFGNGTRVDKIEIPTNHSHYKAVGNEIYSKGGKILYQAFEKDVKTYQIKDGVETIGEYAFTLAPNYEEIIIPKSVQTIKSNAFFNAGNQNDAFSTDYTTVKIHLPKTVKTIGSDAFAYASISVTMDNGIKVIPRGAFKDASIRKMVMPDSVSRLEDFAFYGATLHDLTLSKNINWIGKGPFGNYSSKQKVRVSANNGKIKYVNGVIYSMSGKTVLKAINAPADYKMPKTVRYIRPYAFQRSNVKNVVVPSGVKTISEGAFLTCRDLKKLDLPATVTRIEKDAWRYSGLNTLVMRSTKVPAIAKSQQKVTLIDVKNSRVSAYKKALKGKIAYKTIK